MIYAQTVRPADCLNVLNDQVLPALMVQASSQMTMAAFIGLKW